MRHFLIKIELKILFFIGKFIIFIGKMGEKLGEVILRKCRKELEGILK